MPSLPWRNKYLFDKYLEELNYFDINKANNKKNEAIFISNENVDNSHPRT